MKTAIKLSLAVLTISLFACVDVIDVNVPNATPRLVIEASLDWDKTTPGNHQTIKLSTTGSYFEQKLNTPITNATVKVTNTKTNDEFVFKNENDGNYTIDNFKPVVLNEYKMEVNYNNETYIATDTLHTVADIKIDEDKKSEQQVNVYFDDPKGEKNFYLLKFQEEKPNLAPYLVDLSDEFSDGQSIYYFYEKDFASEAIFESGDVVEVTLYGVSKPFYNYIRLLISQSSGGGPYSPTPVNLKGNCINVTNKDNYPFGYFRVTQKSTVKYTFN